MENAFFDSFDEDDDNSSEGGGELVYMDALADDSLQSTEGRGVIDHRMSPRQDFWADQSTVTNKLMEEFDKLPDDQMLVEEKLRGLLEMSSALDLSTEDQMVRLSHCLF